MNRKTKSVTKSASTRRQDAESPRPRVSPSESLVAVVMGSKSDWETMRHADQTLTDFGVPHECKVMSAHRTPHLAADLSSNAEARGIEIHHRGCRRSCPSRRRARCAHHSSGPRCTDEK
jgi:hypothetical protein